ncbi:hypothetical protein MEQU1_002280 [Malassezia equina]|uniref:Coiled-coil domain-containing protein 12 n=1 Tax=Malassezia equina TaxID=1381935 RepID=A0AAF0IZ57_9BASI|nr:hypothetical protein MEQU1_002280 [Malassezia equina]
MERAAAVRRARIEALRSLRLAEEAGDTESASQNVFGQAVKQSYRTSEPPASALGGAPPADTVEADVDGLQARAIAEDKARETEELDLTNIAPRRPNWDLRRDWEARQQLLVPKTQSALHTLLVQRVGARESDAADVLANEA